MPRDGPRVLANGTHEVPNERWIAIFSMKCSSWCSEKLPGKLIATVGDIDDILGFVGTSLRADLDHPYLVPGSLEPFFDGRERSTRLTGTAI
jgi:hypothetical protein